MNHLILVLMLLSQNGDKQQWSPWKCFGCAKVEASAHKPHRWVNNASHYVWNGIDKTPVTAWQMQRCVAHDEIRVRESK